MEIIIDENLQDTLQKLADDNSCTIEDYAKSVLEGHLGSALRKTVIDQIDSQDFATLKDTNTAVADVMSARISPKQVEEPIEEPVIEG
jgi:hypothetical protein